MNQAEITEALDRTDKMLCVLYGHVVAEQYRRIRLRSKQRKAEMVYPVVRGVADGVAVSLATVDDL